MEIPYPCGKVSFYFIADSFDKSRSMRFDNSDSDRFLSPANTILPLEKIKIELWFPFLLASATTNIKS